jgi:hypothetical protein
LLLVAPSAQHRLLWRRQRKDAQLRIGTAFAIAGTGCLALAAACVVYAVMYVLYGDHLAALGTACPVALIVGGWYSVPLVLRPGGADRRT